MTTKPLLLRALLGEETDRRPVWIMRQAGRFLPEYRELKTRYTFEELCADPELACRVTMMPLERFELDGAITFADLITPASALGVKFRFDPGPIIADPLDTPAEVRALRVPEGPEIAPEVAATQRLIKQELKPDQALLGFAGAPFSLAAYLVEGRGKQGFPRLRAMLHEDPVVFGELMATISLLSARYLVEQHKAGCDAVQVFDSWGGLLDAESWRAAAYPRLWEALGGRAEASASAPVAEPADAFAPPSEAAEGPRRRLAGVGAWPAARAPLTVRWNPWVQGLLLLLGLLLLVMALLLAALAFTGDLVGSTVPEEIPSISGFSIAIALFLVVRYGILRAAARTDRGILLEDDRVLDPTRPVLLQSAVVLPFVSALVIIPALMLSLAALADLWLPVLAFVIGWVLLVLLQGYRRLRLVRLVRAVHVGSDASMEAAARGIHRWGQAWAVLAHFLRGKPEEARKAGEHALLVTDDVANLLRWDAAARGDLDVAAIRALPRPAELGPRFAREVALRLAALRQGDPEVVAEPAVDELHLPNRIGDALHVLEHEIQRRLDPIAAQRTATRLAPELRRGAWIQRCWPDLFDG